VHPVRRKLSRFRCTESGRNPAAADLDPPFLMPFSARTFFWAGFFPRPQQAIFRRSGGTGHPKQLRRLFVPWPLPHPPNCRPAARLLSDSPAYDLQAFISPNSPASHVFLLEHRFADVERAYFYPMRTILLPRWARSTPSFRIFAASLFFWEGFRDEPGLT